MCVKIPHRHFLEKKLCVVAQALHCDTQASLQLWGAGLVAPRHVRILVPQPEMETTSPELQGRFSLSLSSFSSIFITRQILNHWTTREVPIALILNSCLR